MNRKPRAKMDIDVVPYLSIMVIVLKLIGLILIVVMIPIALNPKMIRALTVNELFKGSRPDHQAILSPTYLDCRRDGVTIQPDDVTVGLEELGNSGNKLDRVLDRVEANAASEYVIMIVRPKSLPVYRQIRKLIRQRPIQVAYDVLDEKTEINWKQEARDVNMPLPE